MEGFTLVAAFVAAWILIGLFTALWFARHGHGDPLWVVVAVALGPLFVPIAWERAERHPRLAAAGPTGPPPARSPGRRGLRVLIGLDGSPESQQAFETALELLRPRSETFVLAEVVTYDAVNDDRQGRIHEAHGRLATAASHAAGVPVTYEVLAGPPGEALRQFATEQDIDLLVVGRRGRGLSTLLLGSVSADLVHHARVPVLVAGPVKRGRTSPPISGSSNRSVGGLRAC